MTRRAADTPQQQMGYGGYSVPCRVGNWAEDEYLGALHTAEHIAKSSVGALTTQKLGGLIGRAVAPATLASPPADGFIRFGDALMLSAAQVTTALLLPLRPPVGLERLALARSTMPTAAYTTAHRVGIPAASPDAVPSPVCAQGGVLAVNSYKKVESTQEAYVVTRTNDAGAVPCTRTCWTVCPADGMPAPADGLLRVGMRFYLKTETDDGPLYLQSLRYGLSNLNYSTGISNAQRKNGVSAAKAFSADTAW